MEQGEGMAKDLRIRINGSVYRRLMAMQKRQNIPLGDFVVSLVNQERKRELQKELDSRNGKKGAK
jgi:hypothetical protein